MCLRERTGCVQARPMYGLASQGGDEGSCRGWISKSGWLEVARAASNALARLGSSYFGRAAAEPSRAELSQATAALGPVGPGSCLVRPTLLQEVEVDSDRKRRCALSSIVCSELGLLEVASISCISEREQA